MKDFKIRNQKLFSCFSASAANAAAINPNATRTLLANGLITFFINGKPILINPPNCIISGISVFKKFIIAEES